MNQAIAALEHRQCRTGWHMVLGRGFALALLAVLLPCTGLAQQLRPQTVASGLQNPWALAFLPEGRFLVTERAGRLRVVEPDGRVGAPVAGLPSMAAQGQGGLLDLVLDSDFERNRTRNCASPAGGSLSRSMTSAVCCALSGSGGMPRAARSAAWWR